MLSPCESPQINQKPWETQQLDMILAFTSSLNRALLSSTRVLPENGMQQREKQEKKKNTKHIHLRIGFIVFHEMGFGASRVGETG